MPRLTRSARWFGRPASMLVAITGMRCPSSPSLVPARSANNWEVAGSLHPPKTSTAVADVRHIDAPLSPHRSRNWATPWQAAWMAIDRFRTSASQRSSGTGQISATSSRTRVSPGSSRLPRAGRERPRLVHHLRRQGGDQGGGRPIGVTQ